MVWRSSREIVHRIGDEKSETMRPMTGDSTRACTTRTRLTPTATDVAANDPSAFNRADRRLPIVSSTGTNSIHPPPTRAPAFGHDPLDRRHRHHLRPENTRTADDPGQCRD